jgi:hypothetical protein
MKRLTILLTIILLYVEMALAGPVTAEQAQQAAAQFLQRQTVLGVRRRAPSVNDLRLIATGRQDSYYLFSAAEGEGFVVVSGEDCTESILGYSHTDTLTADNIPCGMQVLLDGYANQIAYLRENGLEAEAAARVAVSRRAATTTMVRGEFRSTFDQGDPYNLRCEPCPKHENERCATGCVATAMAGLMYYHRCPAYITSDIPGYKSKTQGLAVNGFAKGTSIDWTLINDHYTPDNLNEIGREEVAKLMRMAGVSLQTDYDCSSAAYNGSIPYALRQYFGYETITYETSDNYDAATWTEKLRNEIQENGPVLYSGTREDGFDENGNKKYVGHAFLLEGFNSDGYFFVNFGWGSVHNDFFRLDVVDHAFKYILDQSALFGVRPRSNLDPVTTSLRLTNKSVKPESEVVYVRTQQDKNFENVLLKAEVSNYMPNLVENTFDWGYAYRKAGQAQYVVGKQSWGQKKYPFGNYHTGSLSIGFGSGLDYGQYDIFLTSRVSGQEEWVLNDNSQGAHVKAWICGNRMALKSSTPSLAWFSVAPVNGQGYNDLKTGEQTTLSYVVSNTNSTTTYDGPVLVQLVYCDDNGEDHYQMLSIEDVHLASNGSQTLTFRLTPPEAVSMKLQFLDRCWKVISTQTIKAGDNTINPGLTYSSSSVIYWFDNMKELAGQLDSPASVFMLDVSELSDGLHALHIAVSGTNSDDEFVLEGARTVYFEKHGQEAEVTTRYFIDGVEHTAMRCSTGKEYELDIPLANVSEGFYRLTTVMEHTGSGRITTRDDYFARVPTDKELGAMRLECSIDGAVPTTLQRGFTNGVLEYDLDVSEMPSGMHTLAYRVKGTLSTALKKEIFLIDPKVESYEYWLNGDSKNGTKVGKLREGSPWELDTSLSVSRMPLRSSAFEFNVEEGIPVTYTINDFTMRVTTDNGGFDESATVQYVDEASRTYVNSELLEKNKTKKMDAPAAGVLKWLYLKASGGAMIGLQASRQCTMHLYSPDGEELFKVTGKNATILKETRAPLSGTYYVAVHDISDGGSSAEISVTYQYAEDLKKGDVNCDGIVTAADATVIVKVIAGIYSGTLGTADINDDGKVNIGDVIAVINILMGK